ncbi:MAG: sigma-54 dependent transcriptional regulator [Desulfobacteraceae bacterium]|jgi:two-component system nitrogen regulation response regulator NtrX|nr:sigma-54 dependent transcriptional regulator [Desulfobacteraceae bacterium]
MFPSILIVDDEASILKSLSGILSDEGFETITVSNGYEALKTLETESPDLILLDIWMPGIDGIDTLKEIKKNFPTTPVIMITGHGTIETAVNATKIGAFDFIEKPLSIDKVIVGINNALNFRRLEEENRFLRKKTIEKNSITGNCQAIQELRQQISITAPTDAWVLINGENGTGKELISRMIHQFSSRSEYPLIDVNCAALSDEIIESELLGHEKGAFTEATAKKKGMLELAHQGTLFFDEIGDLGLKTQASILRILQEKKFQRIGSSRMLTADVRIISSTNKDLEKEIEAGRFREDLYYRLNVVPITVPPLRERREDIPDLVDTFLKQIAEKNRTIPKSITPDALKMFQNSTWPGNVRELKNLLDRLSIIVQNDTIDANDVPAPYNPKKQAALAFSTGSSLFSMDRLDDALENFENEFIARKLEENNQDIIKTARALNVDKAYLKKRLPKK